MLISPDGQTAGSVGGGIMEHRTILAAQEMLAENSLQHSRVVHFSADGQNADAAIAACGGSMELLLEKVIPGEVIG